MEAKKVKLDYKKIDMKVKIALKRLYLALTWEEIRYGLSFDKAFFGTKDARVRIKKTLDEIEDK